VFQLLVDVSFYTVIMEDSVMDMIPPTLLVTVERALLETTVQLVESWCHWFSKYTSLIDCNSKSSISKVNIQYKQLHLPKVQFVKTMV